jgi:hypothetical protein
MVRFDYWRHRFQSGDSRRTRRVEIEVRRVGGWRVVRTLSLPNTQQMAFSPDAKLLPGGVKYPVPFDGSNLGTRLRCFDVQTGRVIWERDKTPQRAASASDFDWSRGAGRLFLTRWKTNRCCPQRECSDAFRCTPEPSLKVQVLLFAREYALSIRRPRLLPKR